MLRGFMAQVPLLFVAAMLASGLLASPLIAAQDTATSETTPYVTVNGNWRVYDLSPDGTMIVAAEAGAPELCTFAVPSGEEIACANLKAADIRLNPADISWAPDSSAVVFAEMVLTYLQDGDLWLFDARTADLTNLTDDNYAGIFTTFDSERYDEPIYGDVSPAWSPDGATIAFSRTTVGGGSENTPTALWTLDVASGEAREIAEFDPTYPGALYWGMDWSPDGGTIYATAAFAGYRTDDNGVWAFDADTGEAEHLAGPSADHADQAPSVLAVSPAGNALVLSYPVYLAQSGPAPEHSGYALLDLATGEVTPIEPSDEMAGEYAVTVGPNFAPDGDTLIFGVRRPMEEEGFVIARDIATGEETVLARLPDGEMPEIIDPNIPLLISDTGVVYIHNAIESGVVLTLPEEMLAALDAESTPVAGDADAMPTATPADTVVIGDRAAVLRSAPDSDAQILMVLEPGAELEPFGEPIETDGRTWLPVREPETGMLGYVRADFVISDED